MRSDDKSIWRPFCLCKFTTKSFSWMIYLSSLSCTSLFYFTILREDSVEEHSTADDVWFAWFVLCGCLVIDRLVISAIYSKAKSIFSVVQILIYFSCTSFNLFNSHTHACGRSLILLSLTFYHRVADSTVFSCPFCGLCFSVFKVQSVNFWFINSWYFSLTNFKRIRDSNSFSWDSTRRYCKKGFNLEETDLEISCTSSHLYVNSCMKIFKDT